ncbi:MAG: RNA 2',3'-cyclic phosphodiesterase [Gammaproteobacteria bacterium]|nr:RNA 2',3'-cyclic phosphodiesterase [Gammaproteobacteria bacterium]
MRLFFGLEIDPGTCLEIAGWRERMLPPLERPVPARNFHITLVFLGDVAPACREMLEFEALDVTGSPFELTIDELGYFPKPGILWMGPTRVPDALSRLARETGSVARRAGIRPAKRDYHPHLTLARRCRVPPPASSLPPDFQLAFTHFTLFESITAKTGVHYQPLASWPLV